jgi:uncharacterized membrane protein
MEWQKRFSLAVGMLTVADVVLLIFRMMLTGTHTYSFIPWNLFLAWLSFIIAGVLARSLEHSHWSSLKNILLSILWLGFLPNTWYVLTDFIHVAPTAEISQLYDIVLVSLLVFIGFILGFASLFMVHRELLKRYSVGISYGIIEAVILFSSFAIYIGRDLRWNTWDVISNPGGLIVNVSDRLIDPFGSPRALNVTLLFFTLLSLLYLAFWIFTYPGRARG